MKGIEDGASAIPLLRTHQPDVILLDVQLPGLNGFEVCKLIRKDPLLRDARVILLTGRAGAQDRMAGWSAGADDYLIKPCEIPEVLARVAAHLRHREAPQQQWLNPITLLPAPARLEEELQARVQCGESFGACFADIAHFKSYNDRYGYQAGDALLAVLADLMREIVQDLNTRAHDAGTPATSMAGHLGSDDFLLITPPEQVLEASALVAQRFSEVAPSLHRPRTWLGSWRGSRWRSTELSSGDVDSRDGCAPSERYHRRGATRRAERHRRRTLAPVALCRTAHTPLISTGAFMLPHTHVSSTDRL